MLQKVIGQRYESRWFAIWGVGPDHFPPALTRANSDQFQRQIYGWRAVHHAQIIGADFGILAVAVVDCLIYVMVDCISQAEQDAEIGNAVCVGPTNGVRESLSFRDWGEGCQHGNMKFRAFSATP
ncbi:MAG: hypothetical protein CSA68_09295 [Rhodobacterales bacterium]|nr:MAG: hypothetical protein CSA68_09295 [Rhodobacterales bacterium]